MANDQLLTLLNLSRKEVVKVWPKYGFGLKSLPNERREMTKEEKNPKQILIDWVKGVRESAENAKGYINYVAAINGRTEDLDEASDCIADIIGQCKAMMTVLNNSD